MGKETPLPKAKIIPVCLLLFSESFNGNALFAYVGYMVLDLGLADDDKEKVGYYAGLIASCWFLAQFFSSFFWGWMSDVVGRRPVMIFGIFGSFVSSLAFGFSTTLWFAIFSRSLNGILNGNIGVIKTYMAEVTDSTNQARAFGLIGLMWGLGGIVGSAVGGVASRPAKNFPNVFSPTGLFGKFPYLLPNIFSSVLALVTFFIVIAFLKENTISYETVELDEVTDSTETTTPSEATFEDLSAADSLPNTKESISPSDSATEVLLSESETPKKAKKSIISNFLERLRKARGKRKKSKGSLKVLKESNVIKSCTMYAILGFYQTIFDEVLPLLMLADVNKGGLDFSTKSIGIAGSFGGVAIVIVQAFIYHRVANKLKLVRTFRLGTLLTIPVYLLLPCLTFLVPYGQAGVWAGLLTLIAIRCFASQCTFSSVMALITNSAHFKDMGAVNGLGQSLVALLRAIGPTVGGNLLAWSFTNGMPFPLNQYFIFILISLMALIPLVLTIGLPSSLNVPRVEADKNSKQVLLHSEM